MNDQLNSELIEIASLSSFGFRIATQNGQRIEGNTMILEKDNFPSVSIVVLNYNGKQHLEACLNSLSKLNYPINLYDVVLADNKSTDDSLMFVTQNYPWVKILPFDKNYGYAGGNNLAAKSVQGEYVAFLNPDTRVDKNWLIELIIAAMKHRDEGVVAYGGMIKFFDDASSIQVAGSKMCLHGGGYNIGYGSKDDHQFDNITYTLSPPGCAMLVKKDIFLQLGGFDSDYFMYIEEWDFGYRLWLAGFKNLYIPTSIVYHKMGDGFKLKIKPLLVYNEEKNRLITIVKDFEWPNVLKGLIISFFYAAFRELSYFKNSEFELLNSILKGQIDFLRELPRTLQKRKMIQSNRKLRDKDVTRLGLMATLTDCLQELKRTQQFRDM